MKFFFTPLKSKTKIKNELILSVTKAGCLWMGRWTLVNLGLVAEKSFLLSLYEDSARRTLGFKISDILNIDENKLQHNVRLVKPIKTKSGAVYAQIGIKPFIKLLPNLILPCKVKIKEYKDASIGQMYYITLPETSK